jgi:hypothetical protein
MYYPKSQIKTNLFTNGDAYKLSSTNEIYTGYYYEVSNGSKFTGKNPQNPPNILLIPINNQFSNIFNTGVTNNVIPPIITLETIDLEYNLSLLQERFIPLFNPTIPTPQDQQNKQFTRYFCKKNNEIQYLEIDLNTYKKLANQDPQIAWDLYTPAILNWQIVGNKEQVYKSNKASAVAIEQNLKWYGFSQYFQDKFLKYYVES